MIDADVRGKLGRDGRNAHDRAEDLLTSTVFGLLKYLNPADAVLPFVRRARRVSLESGRLVVGRADDGDGPWLQLTEAESVETEFWPSFGVEGEPDVLLTFRD